MKAQELRKKDKKELEKLVIDLRKKLSDLRFKFSSNKLKNVKEIGRIKKEIARILTILNQKSKRTLRGASSKNQNDISKIKNF
jgi:large subunit ribosomal protein L29